MAQWVKGLAANPETHVVEGKNGTDAISVLRETQNK